MDLVFFEPSAISLVAIAIMIGTLVVAYTKKIMMTYALIIANLVVFFLSVIFYEELILELGFLPAYLSVKYSPQIYTLFTAMFIHADVLHLIGNMLVFFFMGIAFEDRIGWKRFLLIYLVTGVIGSLTHAIYVLVTLPPDASGIPLVGASGAIFGILGAFAYAYPWDEVVMPIPIGIMFIMKVKVLYAAIIFSVMETIFVLIGAGQSNTAHFAHFGGLIGGVVVAAIILGRKRETVNARGQRIYTDPNSPYAGRQREIDYSALKKLAVTEKLRDELERIKAENVPQVRDIWLNHFLTQVTCPKCGKFLKHHGNKVSCEDNHFSLKF
jgi:membrane associated rhomboid family serine protease